MSISIPPLLEAAIARGAWHNPGEDALTRILSLPFETPLIRLFPTVQIMQSIARQLLSAGYVDNPEYCMVRSFQHSSGTDDPRLVFDTSIFVGTTVAGDDAILAVDTRSADLTLRILDYRQPIPKRWVSAGNLGDLIEAVSREPRWPPGTRPPLSTGGTSGNES